MIKVFPECLSLIVSEISDVSLHFMYIVHPGLFKQCSKFNILA